MRNFRELIVWQKGMALAKSVYQLTLHLPTSEKYVLQSQLRRCSVSIPSNIAEGCGMETNQATKRYFQIALGSAYECETQILLAESFYGNLLTNNQDTLHQCREVQKLLASFIKALS
jgi:four helix bundle protein